MATLEIARASASHLARQLNRVFLVIKDPSHPNAMPGTDYFSADEDTAETYF